MGDLGSNLFTLPHQIAMAHDAAQAKKLGSMNGEIRRNNETMRGGIYPLLHELSSYLREGAEVHDLTELLSQFNYEELNEMYMAYRKEFLDMNSEGAIQDGAIANLFPEDLTEVSPHEHRKIEGKVKEWLEHSKNFNSQKTQDLYLMIQIGVALLSAFQNAQKEMSQSASFMVRNQRL